MQLAGALVRQEPRSLADSSVFIPLFHLHMPSSEGILVKLLHPDHTDESQQGKMLKNAL